MTQPMYIAAIFPKEAVGGTSGAWISFQNIAQRAASAGHWVEVFSWPQSVPPGPDSVREQVARLHASSAIFAKRLEEIWTKKRPDVVHIELPGTVGDAALQAAAKFQIPTTSSFHYTHLAVSEPQRDGVKALSAKFHKRCTVTVSLGESGAALLSSMGGPTSVVIPDGVDTDIFNPSHRRSNLRDSWGASGDEVVVLWAGRMVDLKGIDVLIQTGIALHSETPSVRFVVAGDGPRSAMIRAALPWAFFPGFLGGSGLSEVFASSDVFLSTSPGETWGNAVLEAAASGLAIVARSGGVAADLLGPRGACVFPLPCDADSFISSAFEVVRDPNLRLSLSSAARSVAEQVDVGATSGRWLELWLRLASNQTPPS